MGTRKPSVLPVPVLACAILPQVSLRYQNIENRFCLHIHAAQGLVDCPDLYIRHSRKLHLVDYGLDDIWMNQTARCKFLEFSDRAIFSEGIVRLCLCCDLLPAGAMVEGCNEDWGQACGHRSSW